MTREIAIEYPASEYAELRGWFEIKIEKASKRGFPDRLYIRNGRTIFIEYKAPGEPPKPQQTKRQREIREHGGEVFVVDNLADAYRILK